MKNFTFWLPPVIEFGCGSRSLLSKYLDRYQVTKPLFICDPGILNLPIIKEVLNSVQNSALWSDVIPNPTDFEVDAASAVFKEKRCDGVIGLGGGSAMDVAKGVAIMAAHDAESFADFTPPMWRKVEGIGTLILIPTTSGTGAEANPWAMIGNSKTKIKDVGYDASQMIGAQKVALVDPELTVSMPPKLTAISGMDAFCQALECFVSETTNPISDAIALHAIEIASAMLPRAFHRGNDLEAREGMALVALMSTIAFPNAGLNFPHQMSTAFYDLWGFDHGLAVAVTARASMEYLIPFKTKRLARVASAMGVAGFGLSERELAEEAVGAIGRLFEDVRIPTLREALNGKVEKIDDLVEHLGKNPPPQGTPISVLEEILRRSVEF